MKTEAAPEPSALPGRKPPPRLLQAGLLLGILAAPLYLGGVHPWSFSIAAALVSAPLLAFALRGPDATRAFTVRGRPHVALLAYAGFFGLAAVGTRLGSATALEAWKLAAVVAFFAATVAVARERAEVRSTATVLVALGAALALFGILQYLGGVARWWWHKSQFLSSVYVNHNHFAGLLEMTLPLAVGLAIAESDLGKKIFLLFCAAVMGVALVFSLSRGGTFAMAAGLAVMAGLVAKRGLIQRAGWIFPLVGGVVVAVLFVFGVDPITERFETLRFLHTDEEPIQRLAIWKGALALAAARPWFGWGPGTFPDVFLRFRPDGFFGRPGHAHNDYLELLADGGIFLFGAAAAVFAALFREGWRVVHRDESRLRIGVGSACLASFTALAVHSLVDFNFHIPANFALFGVLAGLLLAVGGERGAIPDSEGLVLRRIAIAASAAALGGCLLFGVADFWHWQGSRALQAGRTAEARRWLTASLVLNPRNPRARFERGLAVLKDPRESARREGLERALRDLDRAVLGNPFEPYYDLNRVKTYARLAGRAEPEKVRRFFEGVLAKDPKDPQLMLLVAGELLRQPGALARSGKGPEDLRRQAKAALRKAVELDPRSSVRAYRALWEMGRDLAELEAFARTTAPGLRGLLDFLEEDDLWPFHREVLLKHLGLPDPSTRQAVRRVYLRADVFERHKLGSFESVSGRDVHGSEAIYKKGEVAKTLLLPDAETLVMIRARSSAVGGVYGYLVVKLDGRIVDAVYIQSDRFRNFPVLLTAGRGPHRLGLEFLNDRTSLGGAREDRNIWIEEVAVYARRAAAP